MHGTRRDSRVFPMELTGDSTLDGGDQLVFDLVADIREQRDAERRLKLMEARDNELPEAPTEAAFIEDESGDALHGNSRGSWYLSRRVWRACFVGWRYRLRMR